MANGNPEFNLDDCERFFAPIGASIRQFAQRRNLAIIKYDHDSPSWDLAFAHPIGGFGKLVLGKGRASNLELSAVVWIDDYDSLTRRLRQLPVRNVPSDEVSLRGELAIALDEVLSWPLDELFASRSDQWSWRTVSKHDFIASQPAFPVPVSVSRR